MSDALILAADMAGLLAQPHGLAEAAGWSVEQRLLRPRAPWRWITARAWPAPLAALPPETLAPPFPGLIITAGNMAAPVGAALRRAARTPRVVHVQHPNRPARDFDAVLVAEHDGLTGPNVIVTRTALHRMSPARLTAAAAEWGPRLAHLPRPLVAVLVGGGNMRFRLGASVAAHLADQLSAMMDLDRAGLIVTTSRRTSPGAGRALREVLAPRGAMIWDGAGPNPYAGMLALADAIIVTQDSVSMMSEAVATQAPVLMAALPGHSRRQSRMTDALLASGRVRAFAGRLELWPATPLDDTPRAAAELRRMLGL